ncbi:MAG TPA: 3-hydroxyacyl-CoA dehydrogenase family protein [Solirubrobacteraceae bacterium]
MEERLGIAGSGAIACGLAATAARSGEVLLWARSPDSAKRASAAISRNCEKLLGGEVDPDRVTIVDDLGGLDSATFMVEAVVEHHGMKAEILAELGELSKHAEPNAILATTTSSLSISELAQASGHPERFVGFHPFNPVPRMKLIELAFPPEATGETRARARELADRIGKTPVQVPDSPGFVVNRLLFPYLFSAVELMAESGMPAEDVDRCMSLGAGMPMGPLALLDYVGLDVSQAIGESIGAEVPGPLLSLVEEGALGRKSGRGFYSYG